MRPRLLLAHLLASLRRLRPALLGKPLLDGPLVLRHWLVVENAYSRRIGVQHLKARRHAVAEQRGPGSDAEAALAERRSDYGDADGHSGEVAMRSARLESAHSRHRACSRGKGEGGHRRVFPARRCGFRQVAGAAPDTAAKPAAAAAFLK